MLNLKCYTVYENPFDSLLTADQSKSLILVPNPEVADQLRLDLSNNSLLNNTSTTTISEFLKGFLNRNLDHLELEKKSRILLQLALVWKQSLQGEGFNHFLSCYNLFSELRSYTTKFDLITDVLGSFSNFNYKAVAAFWSFFDQMGIVDEHKALFEVSSHLKVDSDKYLNDYDQVIVWGFEHISATQIDLVQSLAIHIPVQIYYPQELYNSATSNDWISWFFPQGKKQSTQITLQANQEGDVSSEPVEFMLHRFPKNRLAETDLGKYKSLCFYSQKLDETVALSVTNKEFFFKEEANIFQAQNLRVKNDLLQGSSSTLLARLDEVEKKAFDKKDYRQLKVCQLYRQSLEELPWLEKLISGANSYNHKEKLEGFICELLHYVCSKDLPRNQVFPLDSGSGNIATINLNQYLYFYHLKKGSRNYNDLLHMVVTSSFKGIVSSQAIIDKNIYSKLVHLGPVPDKTR